MARLLLPSSTRNAVVSARILSSCSFCAFQSNPNIPPNVHEQTKLLSFYADRGNLDEARQVFDKMSAPNEVSWTAMVTAYIRHGLYDEGIRLFCRMQRSGIRLDSFIFPSVLKASSVLQSLQISQQIHCCIIKSGFQNHVPSATALVDVYSRFGRLECASIIFFSLMNRSIVSWNAMIGGLVNNGYFEEALELFSEMLENRQKPSKVTLVLLLSASTGAGKPELVKEIHKYALRSGLVSDIVLATSLVDLYVKCRSVESLKNAYLTFSKMPKRNLFSWNALITGFSQSGLLGETLAICSQMLVQGLSPDIITWTAVIACYARRGDTQMAFKQMNIMQRSGLRPNVQFWTALATAFGQSGDCTLSLESFNQIKIQGLRPDTVSWNAVITAFVQNNYWQKAMNLFQQMVKEGVEPNSITLVTLLTVCSNNAALQQGMEIHTHAIRKGLSKASFIGSSLIGMYAKCGNIDKARLVFETVSQRNLVLCNSMISGYAMHGLAEIAIDLFQKMQQEGLKPDHISFTGILSACSHKGLVMEGKYWYQAMIKEYKLVPTVEHNTCMIDLLGRSGHLDEAWKIVSEMSNEPHVSIWSALLGACRIHQNLELAEVVANRLIQLDPENTTAYVVLANIYAASGRKDDVARVRKMIRSRNLRKSPGCSWIEVKSMVHRFTAGDTSHPQTTEIYQMLDSLALQLKAAGYVPDTSLSCMNVDNELE